MNRIQCLIQRRTLQRLMSIYWLMANIPSFAYSSTVFFSPTLKPSVFEATKSSSADELAMVSQRLEILECLRGGKTVRQTGAKGGADQQGMFSLPSPWIHLFTFGPFTVHRSPLSVSFRSTYM